MYNNITILEYVPRFMYFSYFYTRVLRSCDVKLYTFGAAYFELKVVIIACNTKLQPQNRLTIKYLIKEVQNPKS